MSEHHEAFVVRVLSGSAMMDEIDDFVDAWHDGSSGLPLAEFLGMTKGEYSLWLAAPDALGLILTGRKLGAPIENVASDNLQELRIAARTDSARTIKALQRWRKARKEARSGAPGD